MCVCNVLSQPPGVDLVFSTSSSTSSASPVRKKQRAGAIPMHIAYVVGSVSYVNSACDVRSILLVVII